MSRSITSKFILPLALLLPSVSWGAVVSTGTPDAFADPANTSTHGMTVPADAELIACGVVGYISGVSPYSGGTLTIGGSSMTYIGGDSDPSKMTGGIFYKVQPATGSQTLAWDWAGTNTMEGGTNFDCRYYKGINTGGAVRSTNATQQAASPHTSGTLTASSGDLIIAYSWQFVPTVNATFTWTGATEQFAYTVTAGEVDYSWAEASPTGNQTVSTSVSSSSDGGIGAIVLIASGGGGGGSTARTLTLMGVGQ